MSALKEHKLIQRREQLRRAEKWVCQAASDHCYWGEPDTEAELRDAVAEWRSATGLLRLAEREYTKQNDPNSPGEGIRRSSGYGVND